MAEESNTLDLTESQNVEEYVEDDESEQSDEESVDVDVDVED